MVLRTVSSPSDTYIANAEQVILKVWNVIAQFEEEQHPLQYLRHMS